MKNIQITLKATKCGNRVTAKFSVICGVYLAASSKYKSMSHLTTEQKSNLELFERVKKVKECKQFNKKIEMWGNLKREAKEDIRTFTMVQAYEDLIKKNTFEVIL